MEFRVCEKRTANTLHCGKGSSLNKILPKSEKKGVKNKLVREETFSVGRLILAEG